MYLLMTNDLQNPRNPEEIIQDDTNTRNAENDRRPRTLKQLLCDCENCEGRTLVNPLYCQDLNENSPY